MGNKVTLVVNIYITAWGEFRIPDELYESTQWQKRTLTNMWDDGPKKIIIERPAAVSDNWPFFKWLHEQEVRAGKPDGPRAR